ncbi:hypothetical protein SUGI_0528050 [Cryptomeria japonica]|nr:hypothetical protein SUGI_0528050 [Cryptomeria japonica]
MHPSISKALREEIDRHQKCRQGWFRLVFFGSNGYVSFGEPEIWIGSLAQFSTARACSRQAASSVRSFTKYFLPSDTGHEPIG